MDLNKIYNMNCLSGLKLLPDESIDCCVTSPPYWGLRDYGMEDQLGLEPSPEAFISKLVEVFREVRRVMKSNGTLWVNIGDSYANNSAPGEQGKNGQRADRTFTASGLPPKKSIGLKPKDLVGIPWMLAFALRADGWYLRQDIIWNKPNPMPESVTDRCTKSHEYIFLLSKSRKYYYDAAAIKTAVKDSTVQRMLQQVEDQKGSNRVPGKTNGLMKAVGPGRKPRKGVDVKGGNFDANGDLIGDGSANKKSVWTVTTKPFNEAHFATFPEDLIVDCIKAGTAVGGVVLDPFMGAGTTALVAQKLDRKYIGFELNPEYLKISEKRLYNGLGLFLNK